MSTVPSASVARYNSWTEAEIRQQPDCWHCALQLIQQQRQDIDAFLAPLLALTRLRIILTGAGSSAFIGEAIAPWLHRHCKAGVRAVASTDIVSNPADYLDASDPLLLISFARSGNSPESLAAVQLASQCVADCYHLTISCNSQGALHQFASQQPNALALLLPAATHDRGFAMTSSASTMMLSCLALLAGERFTHERFAPVTECAQQIIRAHGNFQHSAFGDLACKRVVYLGSGGLAGVARESALKVLELSAGKLAAFYDTPLGFRHGPKSIIDPDTLVVMFISADPYTRRYDLDLLAELQRDQLAARIVALAGQPAPVIDAAAHCYLPDAHHFTDIELTFCYLIYGQIFALSESLKAGITPDTPSASGAINRVVKGVIIHPYSQRTED